MHIDETPGLVGQGKKDKKYKRAYFWPILAPDVGVSFFYCKTRGFVEIEKILQDFSGVIVSDAHSAYEKLVSITQQGWQLCWMHIRRKFHEALLSNEEISSECLVYINKLYALERDYKDRGLSTEAKTLARQKESKPVLDEFKQKLDILSVRPEVLTDKLLSDAVFYVLRRWEPACLFVSDGALPIDNGADERVVRHAKLGMKNWLHCSSEEGADATAVLYTLICSALMHGIHPYYYLLDLTKRLDSPGITARDLIPSEWKKLFYEEAVPEEFRSAIAPGEPSVGPPESVKNLQP